MGIDDQGLREIDYKVVPRTLIFLFDEQDRVLLLKKSSKKRLWAGILNGIGGHIEAREDVMEAALRELAEETGITEVALDCCAQIMVDVNDHAGVAMFVFKGNYNFTKELHSNEGELIWVSLDGIEKYHIMEDLFELLPRVADYKQGDGLIIGKYTFDPKGKLITSFSLGFKDLVQRMR